MANTGIQVPDELLDKFDQKMYQLKAEGAIDKGTSRSEIIRQLMEQWVEGNYSSPQKAAPTAD